MKPTARANQALKDITEIAARLRELRDALLDRATTLKKEGLWHDGDSVSAATHGIDRASKALEAVPAAIEERVQMEEERKAREERDGGYWEWDDHGPVFVRTKQLFPGINE